MRYCFLWGMLWLMMPVALGCDHRPVPSPVPSRPAVSSDSPAVEGTHDAQARDVLRRAASWLRDQQAEDGGWHSPQYGILKSGQCYTPYVMDALRRVPHDLWGEQPPDFAAAIGFIRRHVRDDGVIGMADSDVLEYPNYATAYAVQCLLSMGTAEDRELAAKQQRFLAAEQYAERRGLAPDSPAYGGWGFGGTHPPGETGHMDLAHTRRVLQAIEVSPVAAMDAGYPIDETTLESPVRQATSREQMLERGQRFLAVVQRRPGTKPLQPWPPEETPRINFAGNLPYDGGFYFSPIVLGANKGRVIPATDTDFPYYRSYATATCDGLLALLAAGVPKDDQRVVDARRWLFDHPRLDYPEGIPEDHPEPWGAALHFYHLSVRAEAYAAVGGPQGWQGKLVRLLAKEQREDGSFRNEESPLMKEDDPVMATTLAVTALTHGLLDE